MSPIRWPEGDEAAWRFVLGIMRAEMVLAFLMARHGR
jgi:hypothetical protein